MSKFSNIYDIDGNLIHKAGDGPYTLEQTEKLVDELTKKVQDNPDNQVYKVYLNNAQKWLFKLYNELSKEDLMKRISIIQENVDEAKKELNSKEQEQLSEVNKAITELKEWYDNESKTTPENAKTGDGGRVAEEVEHPVVDNNTPEPVVMDEYVDFEENETN